MLTTAGKGQESLAYKEVAAAKRIQLGEITDPHVLPIIFECAADADWRDEETWHKALPGLESGYPSLQALRERRIKAEYSLIEREILQQLYLGVWQNQSASPFVPMDVYDRCGSVPVDFASLKGRPAFLGVDLSEVSDLTAQVMAWPTDDDRHVFASLRSTDDALCGYCFAFRKKEDAQALADKLAPSFVIKGANGSIRLIYLFEPAEGSEDLLRDLRGPHEQGPWLRPYRSSDRKPLALASRLPAKPSRSIRVAGSPDRTPASRTQ